MTLAEAVDAYIALKQSLGAVFSADARILRSFYHALGDIPVRDIDPQATHAFCRGKGAPTRWWQRKDETLRGFFAWLVGRGHITACPLPAHRPRVPRSFRPRICTRDELQRLLDATAALKHDRFPLREATFRTLLLLLYGAGLRSGETLRLRCCDVDLRDRVLAVNNTKFFKSRLVPVGVALADALAAYADQRRHLPMPAASGSAFFASPAGTPVSRGQLERAFAHVRVHAGLRGSPARRGPRLHDLRHTFAVHRLVSWYRDGADVQASLPLLATYLGHVGLAGTQAYLPMTAELLDQASQRFARYAGVEEQENHDA